ncbi:hypothetical protein BsWGS_27932 [Bradybaena similaris]
MLTYAVRLIIVSHALAGATFVNNFKIGEPVIVSPEKPRVALLDQPAEGAGYKLSYADYHVTWEEFKSTFSKRYATIDEERSRYNIFMENVNLIEQHNWEYHNGRSSFYLDINHFADLTNEEYRARRGFRANATELTTCTSYKPETKDVPESEDWRERGYVTAVKFQGDCGACWAFVTTGAVEAQWFKKTGKLVSLSEEQLIDCSNDYGNKGCDGGVPDFGFKYISVNGIEEESVYPYEKKQGKCRYDKSKVAANITTCYRVWPEESEEALKVAVGQMGPVTVGIDSRRKEFVLYKGGIYDDEYCSSTELDHAILVVGYGTLKGQDFWIIKNSWGEEWGEKGFALMSRNKDNQCGIATQASFPVY